MISLYPHQSDLLGRTSAAMKRGVKRPLICGATGIGKTRIATAICEKAIQRGFLPIWFMVHRKELLDQTAQAFADGGLPIGLVARGYPTEGSRPVQVVLIDSLPKRINYLQPPRLIIPDEAHHCVAPKWKRVQEAYPQAFYCGLTATAARLDGRGLGAHFDEIIEGPPMRWLIDNGYLTDYRIFAPPPLDMTGVHKLAGDYNKHEMAEVVAKSTIVGDSIAEYRKHAMGKRCIIRSVSVEASAETAEAFKAAGFTAVHLDGKTPDGDRRRMFNDFRRGEITHLCNVDLFGEGVDVPGVECLIDLRPTESLTYFLQYVGRMMRPAPGKTHGIYLDQVGNTMRHGMPDTEREWSLDGKRKKVKPPKIFTCKSCYGAFANPFRYCPLCGEKVEGYTGARADPERVEGELQELTGETVAKHRRAFDADRARARTLEDLIAYGKSKGYKDGWALRVHAARIAKRTAA